MVLDAQTQAELNQFAVTVAGAIKPIKEDLVKIKENGVSTSKSAIEKPENLYKDDASKTMKGKYIDPSTGIYANNDSMMLTAPFPVKKGVEYFYEFNTNWFGKQDRTDFYVENWKTEQSEAQIKARTEAYDGVHDGRMVVAERRVYFTAKQDGYSRVSLDIASYGKDFAIYATEQYNKAKEEEGKGSIEDRIGKSNVLYGKKWFVAGDSYSDGLSVNTDRGVGSGKKAYSYFIAQRNDMILENFAVSGSWLTKGGNVGTECFADDSKKGHAHYTDIPADADYVTLAFGLNESDIGTKTDGTLPLIGTKNDTTNTTLWGAYYKTFEHIFKQNPNVKVGVILQDAWQKKPYRDAVKEICAAWGVPVLDLKDPSVPMFLTSPAVDKDRTLARARALRSVPITEDNHPTEQAQINKSTVIENFLRSL